MFLSCKNKLFSGTWQRTSLWNWFKNRCDAKTNNYFLALGKEHPSGIGLRTDVMPKQITIFWHLAKNILVELVKNRCDAKTNNYFLALGKEHPCGIGLRTDVMPKQIFGHNILFKKLLYISYVKCIFKDLNFFNHS